MPKTPITRRAMHEHDLRVTSSGVVVRQHNTITNQIHHPNLATVRGGLWRVRAGELAHTTPDAPVHRRPRLALAATLAAVTCAASGAIATAPAASSRSPRSPRSRRSARAAATTTSERTRPTACARSAVISPSSGRASLALRRPRGHKARSQAHVERRPAGRTDDSQAKADDGGSPPLAIALSAICAALAAHLTLEPSRGASGRRGARSCPHVSQAVRGSGRSRARTGDLLLVRQTHRVATVVRRPPLCAKGPDETASASRHRPPYIAEVDRTPTAHPAPARRSAPWRATA